MRDVCEKDRSHRSAETDGPPLFAVSRYNFFVPTLEGPLLYNARTGAVIAFDGRQAAELASLLSDPTACILSTDVHEEVLVQLVAGGFVRQPHADELDEIGRLFRSAREATPMVLTLTTTMDCNLGCFYCYEERSGDRLVEADVNAVVEFARERLCRSSRRSIHVDWYGGEPLLNVEFLEACSLALQGLCEELRVRFSASVISNGTGWPADPAEFVRRHRIRQVQISFDGMRKSHNRSRRYRKGYEPQRDASSFDEAVDLVDRLLEAVRVDVRMNIGPRNVSDVVPFLEFVRARGWFDKPYPAVIQPARLSAYSERSSFLLDTQLTSDEFDEVRAVVRREVGAGVTVEESEVPDGFPFPRTSVCAALASDSFVVGADLKLYRCGLQVGEIGREVGSVAPAGHRPRRLPVLGDRSDQDWWVSFDPTELPNCARCSFLPICWGGCPKKHLEGDARAIAEQSEYWRRNLAQLVARGVGRQLEPGFTFSECDQFRGGYIDET